MYSAGKGVNYVGEGSPNQWRFGKKMKYSKLCYGHVDEKPEASDMCDEL